MNEMMYDLKTLELTVASFIKSSTGKLSAWKFKDECPMARIRREENVPLLIEDDDAVLEFTNGIATSLKIWKTVKKEDQEKETSFFNALPPDAAAKKWVDENYPVITAKTKEAISQGWESFSISTHLSETVNERIGHILKADHGFIGAKTRRGKLIVAIKPCALAEKPKRIRDRSKNAPESSQTRPEKLLKTLAVNYLTDNKTAVIELSERARAKAQKTFSLVPKELDRDAWYYLAQELKAQGYKDARVKKNKIVVLVTTDVTGGITDDDFLDI